MSWDEFKRVFQKEFLPRNEKYCNWITWDLCKSQVTRGHSQTRWFGRFSEGAWVYT